MEDREGVISGPGPIRGIGSCFREGIFHRVEVPDADRITWMMNSREGEASLPGDAKRAHSANASILSGNIVTLRLPEPAIGACQDTDGTIWLSRRQRGSAAGLGRGFGTPPQLHGGPILQIGCAYGDVWIGDSPRGIIRFSGGKAMSVTGLRIGGWDASFFIEGPGRVWYPYADGKISVYDNGTIREYGKRDGLPEKATYTIAKSD